MTAKNLMSPQISNSSLYFLTVEPRYNEPRYNEHPVITNNILKPGRISVKYMETNPAITKSLL